MRHLVAGVLVALLLFPHTAASRTSLPVAVLSNASLNGVLIVDPSTDEKTAIPVGSPTYGVAVDPVRGRAYLTDQNLREGRLYVVDLSSRVLIGTVPVGRVPHGVAVSRDGRTVYVANVMDHTVSVVDAAKVSEGRGAIIGTLPAGVTPWGMVLSPDESRIYVTNVVRSLVTSISLATRETAQVASDGGQPSGIALSPDGNRLYVTDFGGGRMWVIDVARVGTSSAILNRVPVGPRPYAVALNREGTRAYVTNSASNTVSVVDISRPGAEAVVETLQVGARPHGVAMSADGSFVYVASFEGQSLSIINTATHQLERLVKLEGNFPVAFGSFVVPSRILTVQVDVKPGGNPNVINPKSRGTTPVAILGSTDYDVTQVDVSTVRLAGAPVARKPNGAYMESFDDVNGDGLIDLVLHFETASLQVNPGDTSVTLEGQMNDGTAFSGTDSVKVVP